MSVDCVEAMNQDDPDAYSDTPPWERDCASGSSESSASTDATWDWSPETHELRLPVAKDDPMCVDDPNDAVVVVEDDIHNVAYYFGGQTTAHHHPVSVDVVSDVVLPIKEEYSRAHHEMVQFLRRLQDRGLHEGGVNSFAYTVTGVTEDREKGIAVRVRSLNYRWMEDHSADLEMTIWLSHCFIGEYNGNLGVYVPFRSELSQLSRVVKQECDCFVFF